LGFGLSALGSRLQASASGNADAKRELYVYQLVVCLPSFEVIDLDAGL
jgi:hypothetical protein